MARYQLFATEPNGTAVASYAEGDSVLTGLKRCREQFPPEEGYTAHYIEDTDTGKTTELELLEFMLGD